ncbi:MAG: alpha/beta fold hydrolase [Simkaniaceae bacterium]|nr:alpha/beta fold hydrolase [Simkaniaceae bacterium]
MPSSRPLVFLHGLFGSPDDWNGIADKNDLCLTLPGHCYTPVAPLLSILDLLPKTCDLVGYSMGGRIAMQLKLLEPDRIGKIVILSANPGIEDIKLREDRRALDINRAQEIRTNGLPQFLETWYNKDLFEPLRNAKDFDAIFERRLQHKETSVAKILEEYSIGTQTPLWEGLMKHKIDTRFIFGQTDFSYEPIAKRLEKDGHRVVIMQTCGHAMHLEVPGQSKQIIKRFIND